MVNIRVISAPPYFPRWRISAAYRNRYSVDHFKDLSVRRCPLWVPRRPTGLTRLLHLATFALELFPPFKSILLATDVVITVAPAFFCTPGALLLGRLCGRRTFTWLHLQDFELDAAFELGLLKGPLIRSLAEIIERKILRAFNRVSSISAPMVHKLNTKGVPISRSILLPNWVDLDIIYPQSGLARQNNSYRSELGIKSDQLVLMYSGSMNKKQGLDLLLRSFISLLIFLSWFGCWLGKAQQRQI